MVGLFACGVYLIGPQYRADAPAWGVGTVVIVLALGMCAQANPRCRGFFPGMLLGLLLTCLVPVGVVAIVCGPWHR